MPGFPVKFLVISNVLLTSVTARAAIHEVDGFAGTSENPYQISSSYSGETEQIIKATGNGNGKAYINVAAGTNFDNNNYTEKTAYSNMYGIVVDAKNSVIHFGGNNRFANNKFTSTGNTYGVLNAQSEAKGDSNRFSFGNNILFENNVAKYGAAIIADATYSGENYFNFADNVTFKNNSGMNGYSGGAVGSLVHGANNDTSRNEFNFGNNIVFEGNSGVRGGAIITDTYGDNLSDIANIFNFYGHTVFKDNYASSYGGGIYSEVYGYNSGHSENSFNFYGTTEFTNNAAGSLGGAILLWPRVDEASQATAKINFSLQEPGEYVLFEGNKARGSLNSLYLLDGHADFNLPGGTYADIRDPIAATDNTSVNKGSDGVRDGKGGLYLWGDNSQFSGQLNINSGSFYAMFEENQTAEEEAADPLGQRKNFTMPNAQVSFGADSLFRPMMNQARNYLAPLNMANVTGAGNAILAPYEISRLESGNYTFNNDFNGFQGFDSPLAELKINGSENVQLNIKRNLEGYKGLSAAADAYRRGGLGYIERQEMDDIYLSGVVSEYIRDLFEVAGGEDYLNYTSVHRATVRQFNREVEQRLDVIPWDGVGGQAQNLWINPFYSSVKRQSSRYYDGYKYETDGVAVGFDTASLAEGLVIGAAAAYSDGDVKTHTIPSIASRDDVRNILISIYGKYQPERAFVSWNAGGGWFRNKTYLYSETINTTGKNTDYALFGDIRSGYNLGEGNWLFEPYVGMEYTHLVSREYSEKGDGARHFDRGAWNVFETPLGLRTGYRFMVSDYWFTPAVDIAYARNWGDKSIKTRSAFVDNLADSWRVESDEDNRDSIRLGIDLEVKHGSLPLAFNLGYATDHRSGYNDRQFQAAVRWDF